jgi:hypothetical protein
VKAIVQREYVRLMSSSLKRLKKPVPKDNQVLVEVRAASINPIAATVCTYLWLKSGYIPKPLAVLGVILPAWCVICALVFLIFPTFYKLVNAYWFDSPMAIFELILSFWLLFRGLKPVATNQVQAGVV